MTQEASNTLHATHVEKIPMRISRTRGPSSARMKRLLKNCDVTVDQFTDWMGWDVRRVLAANPSWTEREWCDLILENNP